MNSEESAFPRPNGEDNEPPEELVVPSDLLERIPEEEREEFSRKLVNFGIRVTREEYYSGPLQPAKEAERWEALVPGSAERNFNLYEQQQRKLMEAQDRILTTFEVSVQHKIDADTQLHKDHVELTKTQLKNNSDEVRRGQWFAIIAMILFTGGGFLMVHLGHNEVGIAAFVVEGIAAAKWFLHDTRNKRRASPSKQSASESRPMPSE